MHRALIIPFVTMLLAPAASAQTASPIRPGSYRLEITFGGGTMDGMLEVALDHDSTVVTLKVGDHLSPVQPTLLKGNRLVLDSNVPGQTIHYDLLFKADSVKGPFTFGGDIGSVAGVRLPATH